MSSFDFGANLRLIAASGPTSLFSHEEIQFVQRVLKEGALLEDESFHLAARILSNFVSTRGVQAGHWLILNGLPRHIGQARRLEGQVQVRALIQLECGAGVVRERLRCDPAGDRSLRADDHDELLHRKLSDYERRTRPLIEFYAQRGAQLITFAVGAKTQPHEIAQQLDQMANAIPGLAESATDQYPRPSVPTYFQGKV